MDKSLHHPDTAPGSNRDQIEKVSGSLVRPALNPESTLGRALLLSTHAALNRESVT